MLRRISDAAVIVLALVFAGFMWRANTRLSAVEHSLAASRTASPARASLSGTVANVGIPIGARTAPVTLVQFTDFQCPFCGRFASETLPGLYTQYVQTGKVRILVRELPLPMHRNARMLAHASECAQRSLPPV